MSKAATVEPESKPRKRGTRFVPLEDVPGPGMSQRAREVVALALCGVALYAMLCLATFRLADPLVDTVPTGGMQNLGGAVGYYLAHGFSRTLGLAGWIPWLLLVGGALALFLGRPIDRLVIKVLGAVVFSAMLAILFAGADGRAGVREITPWGAGGVFGSFVSPRLEAAFGGTGRLLLVGFGSLVSFLLATEWMFSQVLLRLVAALDVLWRRLRREPQALAVGAGASGAALLDEVPRARRGRRKAMVDESDVDVAQALDGVVAEDVDDAEEERPDVGAVPEVEASSRSRRRSRARAEASEDDRGADDELDADREDAAAEDASGGRGPEPEQESEPEPETAPETESELETPAAPKVPIVVRQRPKPAKARARKVAQSTLPFDEAYPFPPVELFQESLQNDVTETSEVLERGGEAIVSKLANFNMKCEIVAASVGPAVTQYEIRLEEGIRVNKLQGFELDLAAALKAVSVRVVAPIPGKDTIGIEVPNGARQKVFMRDLLDLFGRSEDKAIPLFLGKDVAGNPIVEDLARMPHLLIAGTTGSGKSVCINTILLSILMTRTPRQVQLILVDPKMVELQAYKQVPHLCCDVVTNMKKAPAVLQWAVDEMENRYALLSAAGVNHIKNYNRLGEQELKKRLQRDPVPERIHLPYIVIVIDEFADLMNVAQNEVEESIQRLAQKSRAVGMHVILATQRPSSDVITGIIKANLPCQIAFKVNRKIDSRVILDSNGAEKLLGHGDMLYMPPGGAALIRAQGTFVADDEQQSVVRFLEEHGQRPSFNPALVQTQTSSRSSGASRDELYPKAVEVILGQQRGSATLIQRALGVGYTRATRLLELMEEDGLVGAFVGAKAREVLMTLEEYQQREAMLEEELAAIDAGVDEQDVEEDAAVDGDAGDDGEAAEGAAALEGEEPDDDDGEGGGEDEGGDLEARAEG